MSSFPQSFSDCPAILDWEAAGASLLSALTNYANSCLSLGTYFKEDDPHTRSLPAQIDSALEIHSAIALQLKISGASLANTRNKFRQPFSRVPEEILSKIFLQHVYDPKTYDELPRGLLINNSMERRLWHIYRRRQNLLSVCSFWRRIISTRSEFWSILPVTTGLQAIGNKGLETSLQRADGTPLHLAVATSDIIPDRVLDALSNYLPQVELLSINSRSVSVTRRVLTMFILKSPSRLSRLSLCGEQVEGDSADRSAYIFTNDEATGSFSINTLIESLPTLWIDSAYFHWDPSCARNLVDLRIENLMFATHTELVTLIGSISSAPQLRDLRLISVNCVASREPVAAHKIEFPNLQHLTLEDLHLNVLQLLFAFIDPGSHSLALGLTYLSVCYRGQYRRGDPNLEHYVEELLETLSQVRIESLLLDEDLQSKMRRESITIPKLLGCMPELQTLVLSRWRLGKAEWEGLVYPDIDSAADDPNESPFPQLENLHLISSYVVEEEGLKDVVKSHQLKKLELGGQRYDASNRQLVNPRPLSDGIVNWLWSEVPEFRLVGHGYRPPVFSSRQVL